MLAAALAQDGGDAGDAGDAGQLGDAGKRALARERERAKAAEEAQKATRAQMDELTKQLDALKPAAELFAQFRKVAVPEEEKTDTERLQEQIAQLQKETTEERKQRWLLEVIRDEELTPEWAEWLRGDSKEELQQSAQKLKSLMPQPQPAPPPSTAEATPTQGQQEPAAEPAPAPNGPKPDPSQGARGPVDLNAQIEEALSKGDIKTSIALKRQLAAQNTK